MPRALFVHASDDFARSLYEREGRPYWSRMLPVVLEQFGYLAFDVADERVLEDPATFQDGNVLLIGRLPDASWTPAVVDRVVSGRASALIEGPVAPPLAAALGVERVASAPAEGRLRTVDPRLVAAATEHGATASAAIGMVYARGEERDPSLDWTRFDVGITENQAQAWRSTTWDASVWRVAEGTDVLAEWQAFGEGDWHPAIVNRGRVYACCLGLFDVLVRHRSSQPYPPATFLGAPPTLAADALLLGLIDRLHVETAMSRFRVLPWPKGASFVLTVRHDFDRRLPLERVHDVLQRHKRAGTAATWYWRPSHFTGKDVATGRKTAPRAAVATAKTAARAVASAAHHEVAVHTEQLWAGGSGDLRIVERAVGARVYGSSAHGDRNCFRFQGAPNVLWAERQHLVYTELIEQSQFHPHRFVDLPADGIPHPLHVICLPKHASFDQTTKPNDIRADEVREHVARAATASGLVQVMNHPDIHVPQLFELLEDLPRLHRLDWTAREATTWWRRTHTRDELRLTALGRGAFTATSASGVEGAVLEELLPDGEIRLHDLNLPAREIGGRSPKWRASSGMRRLIRP